MGPLFVCVCVCVSVCVLCVWLIWRTSYNWWGFQAWDTLQDSTANSSFDKVETTLEWQEYFSQFQDRTDARPSCIHLPVCLWILDPHSRDAKKNASHGNEVLPQDTTHLIQRPCYQRGSLCQDLAGNWTTWRPPDHRKEMQTVMVWSCLPFTKSGQNHLARHGEMGKKTRQTEREVGRWHQGMDRPWVLQVPEGSGEQRKMEETGCEIIRGGPTTFTIKGLMMTRWWRTSYWVHQIGGWAVAALTRIWTHKLMLQRGVPISAVCSWINVSTNSAWCADRPVCQSTDVSVYWCAHRPIIVWVSVWAHSSVGRSVCWYISV